jgi:hypothetical protein
MTAVFATQVDFAESCHAQQMNVHLRTGRLDRATVIISISLLAIVGGALRVDAKPATRTEKAFGVCVDVSARLFPNKGSLKERPTNEGSITELSVLGPKQRELSLGSHPSYEKLRATEVLGWVTEEIRVDKVTPTKDGYDVIGLWDGSDPETGKEVGGPWRRRTVRNNDGTAVAVDFFFTTADYKQNRKSITKSITSVRSC